FPKGVRRWLKFSFNAPVPVRQSQPGSRASGCCSKAFLASLYRCAAPPAVKCTNGFRRTHGWARCYHRTLRCSSAVLELRLRMIAPRGDGNAECEVIDCPNKSKLTHFERLLGPGRGCE